MDSWKFIRLRLKMLGCFGQVLGKGRLLTKGFNIRQALCPLLARRRLVCPPALALEGELLLPHGEGGDRRSRSTSSAVLGKRLCRKARALLRLHPLGSRALRRADVKGQGREGLGPVSAGQSWALLLNGATLTTSGLHLKFQMGDKGWSPKGSQSLC